MCTAFVWEVRCSDAYSLTTLPVPRGLRPHTTEQVRGGLLSVTGCIAAHQT